MLTVSTLYQIEKMKKFEDFDVVQMNFDRKRTEEGKINKTCALVPKNTV